MDDANLDLDVDEEAVRGGRTRTVLRVCVAEAFGFTRSGGGATLTRDCTSLAAFEREVARLHGELDDILARARERMGEPPAETGGAGEPAAEPRAAEPAAGEARTLPPDLGATLRVADLMTREVTTVGPNDRLALADELMKQGRFRHLVVVEDGAVTGVVSQRDIFYGALAWSMGVGRRSHDQALASSPVKEVMRTDVVTVDPEVPLAEAARTLMERKIGCLPVLEADRLVGILTESDFLALLTRAAGPEAG